MKFDGSFGTWLRQRRKTLDLTQSELADQVGYSVVTLRKIERDVVRPSKQMTEQLADVLAIAAEDRACFVAFARRRCDPRTVLSPEAHPMEGTHHLPPQPTTFVGRASELMQIRDFFRDEQCRLLTLVGPGGIGKTRLAIEALHEDMAHFSDGVYFVPLAAVSSPDLLVSALASVLKMSLHGPEDPVVQLIEFLSERHLLFLLDSFEQLLAGTRLLCQFLENCPQLKLLVTSRERLCIQEEWVLEVQGLPYPESEVIENAKTYSAVQLFVQRARQGKPTFSLADNMPSVVEICRMVDGMPLAIELAATWVRVMSCREIAEHLERRWDFLATPLRNVPERHRSLRAVSEQSWQWLSEMERHVLARLSIFRGGFDLNAAEAVAGASLTLLGGLADKSLIRLSPSGRFPFEVAGQMAGEWMSS